MHYFTYIILSNPAHQYSRLYCSIHNCESYWISIEIKLVPLGSWGNGCETVCVCVASETRDNPSPPSPKKRDNVLLVFGFTNQ